MICVIMTYVVTAGLTRLHIQRASGKVNRNSLLGIYCARAVPVASVIVRCDDPRKASGQSSSQRVQLKRINGYSDDTLRHF
jgi:hypothetical protein